MKDVGKTQTFINPDEIIGMDLRVLEADWSKIVLCMHDGRRLIIEIGERDDYGYGGEISTYPELDYHSEWM